MGYVPSAGPAPRLSVDKYGLPRDFATYMWLLYRKRVRDESPTRLAHLAALTPDPGRVVQR